MYGCLPASCLLFPAVSGQDVRKAAYSEQAATPPWFPAVVLELERAGGGSECPQVTTDSVDDTAAPADSNGVSLCLIASFLSSLAFCLRGTTKVPAKV